MKLVFLPLFLIGATLSAFGDLSDCVLNMSHYDNCDTTGFPRLITDDSVTMVIHKATEGAKVKNDDAKYPIIKTASDHAGLMWGAYHFGRSDEPAVSQADHFLSIVTKYKHDVFCRKIAFCWF